MMEKYKLVAGWMLGYYAILYPINLMIKFSPISALISGIIGVGGSILAFKLAEREERWQYD